jgi:ATP-dependent Clp protease ATP-binding subunit ClpB
MAATTQSANRKQLDPRQRSSASRHFEDALRQKIVGQDEAIQALSELYQVFCAGLRCPGRPVGNLLFLGPTGSGKTRIVEAAAEILFGESRMVIKVDCAEFQHSHEIAKLIGSPPRLSWAPRNTSADHAGSVGGLTHRPTQIVVPAI